jgi:hypothetical protein
MMDAFDLESVRAYDANLKIFETYLIQQYKKGVTPIVLTSSLLGYFSACSLLPSFHVIRTPERSNARTTDRPCQRRHVATGILICITV